MKHFSFIILAGLVYGISSFAKGPMLQGTYKGSGEKNYELSFVSVNIPSTTTRIASCNFDSACLDEDKLIGHFGDESYEYLRDIVITNISYRPDNNFDWKVDYAFVNEDGLVLPLFSIKVRDFEGTEGIQLLGVESEPVELRISEPTPVPLPAETTFYDEPSGLHFTYWTHGDQKKAVQTCNAKGGFLPSIDGEFDLSIAKRVLNSHIGRKLKYAGSSVFRLEADPKGNRCEVIWSSDSTKNVHTQKMPCFCQYPIVCVTRD